MGLDISSLVDVPTVVTLLAVGFGLKYIQWTPIKRISNKLIPVFLLIMGVLMVSISYGDVTFDSVFIGFVSSMFAIGIHSSGKNIFSFFNGNTLTVDAKSLNHGVVENLKEAKQQSIEENAVG